MAKKKKTGIRQGFSFLRSYYDVAMQLDDKNFISFMKSLLEKQFNNVDTELTDTAKFAYISQRHSIDSQVEGFIGYCIRENLTAFSNTPSTPPSTPPSVPPSTQEEEKEKEKEEVKEEVKMEKEELDNDLINSLKGKYKLETVEGIKKFISENNINLHRSMNPKDFLISPFFFNSSEEGKIRILLQSNIN